jgi:hypothetical protein
MIEAVERSEKFALHIQRWNVPLFGINKKIKVKKSVRNNRE